MNEQMEAYESSSGVFFQSGAMLRVGWGHAMHRTASGARACKSDFLEKPKASPFLRSDARYAQKW